MAATVGKNPTQINARPTVPTRRMSASEVKDIAVTLEQINTFLASVPVWIDYAELTVSKAGQCGPEDELGTIILQTLPEEETTDVYFKPYGS